MALQLAVFTGPSGVLMADWSGISQSVEFSTNQHGFQSCTAFVPLPSAAAFSWFNHPGLPWIEVWGADLAWKGRFEDVRLVPGGISISALGAWSVFGDVPYNDTPASPTTSDAIVADILAAARLDNAGLLGASTALIEAPGVDVYDEEFTDADMRAILTRMATLGDSETPPRQWEVGIWRNNMLHFRPRGTDARAWYVDAADLEIERTLSTLINSAYTRYDSGAALTTTETDAFSVARHGVTRRRAVSSRAGAAGGAQADRERDAALADGATPIPRAAVTLDCIYTASGTRGQLWEVRSGDTLTIRNLPPEAGDIIDRIRTFRIAETRYTCDSNTLDITPESPLPTLDVLVSRALEVPS